jgi:MFS family permease
MFSAITGLAVASGPLVGGAVVDGLAWEWIFWINVPIGLLAVPPVLRRMRESRGAPSPLDLPGLGLVSVGAFALVWGLVRADAAGWGSPEVLGALILGAVLSGAFVWWERRAPAPMIPLDMFRSRTFAAGNAAIFCTFAALFAGVFFFAQLLQVTLGYGPLEAGLRLVPWTATFLTIAPAAGALSDRIGERPLIVGGLLLQVAGYVWIALIAGAGLTYGALVLPLVLAGVGVSMAIPAAQSTAVATMAPERLGKAAGTNSMVRQLGGVFGVAVTAAVFAGAGGSAVFTDGFAPAIAVAAGFSFAGALAGLWLPVRRSVAGKNPHTAEVAG